MSRCYVTARAKLGKGKKGGERVRCMKPSKIIIIFLLKGKVSSQLDNHYKTFSRIQVF
jgi:hypothetical protein